jgi:hypothetical protein
VHGLQDAQVVAELPDEGVLLAGAKPLRLAHDGPVKALQALLADVSIAEHAPVRTAVAIGLQGTRE